MTQQTLSARLAAEAAAKAAAVAQAVDKTAEVAAAWDASGYTGRQPWIVSGAKGIYGDHASLSFKDVGPDELAALMRAFPAVEKVQYSHNCTRYFHPIGARAIPEGVTVSTFDGYEVEVSGGRGYETLRASWSAMVGEIQTSFRIDLRRVHFLHPRATRRAVVVAGTFIRFEGPATLAWPRDFDGVKVMRDNGVQGFGYALSETSVGDFRLRGSNVLALAEAWEAEANRRGAETQAAFLAALAPVEAIGLPTAEDVAAKVEGLRDWYSREKLRAGTLEQTAALKTPHAEADRALAEKHWEAYAEHNGLDAGRYGFDHFTWACAFLKRCGLYEVTIEGKEKPYHYGCAWL